MRVQRHIYSTSVAETLRLHGARRFCLGLTCNVGLVFVMLASAYASALTFWPPP